MKILVCNVKRVIRYFDVYKATENKKILWVFSITKVIYYIGIKADNIISYVFKSVKRFVLFLLLFPGQQELQTCFITSCFVHEFMLTCPAAFKQRFTDFYHDY